jgi:quinol monooxygenase YgiN
MLIRIVRMTFEPDQVPAFLDIFKDSQPKIRAMAGCQHVELWQDLDQPHIFVTHSHWDDAAALDAYRNSTLFKGVWAKTKVLFAGAPLAFSVKKHA